MPSVPPAAEPVPHLQTPNSDPQTMARECPQSSKPPSGSKSGLRNTPGCLHASNSKAAGGHSHPKQQRISRRRATNGWIPVGTACEKAVYVVVGVRVLGMGRDSAPGMEAWEFWGSLPDGDGH